MQRTELHLQQQRASDAVASGSSAIPSVAEQSRAGPMQSAMQDLHAAGSRGVATVPQDVLDLMQSHVQRLEQNLGRHFDRLHLLADASTASTAEVG